MKASRLRPVDEMAIRLEEAVSWKWADYIDVREWDAVISITGDDRGIESIRGPGDSPKSSHLSLHRLNSFETLRM
jgi:hypothetical protein